MKRFFFLGGIITTLTFSAIASDEIYINCHYINYKNDDVVQKVAQPKDENKIRIDGTWRKDGDGKEKYFVNESSRQLNQFCENGRYSLDEGWVLLKFYASYRPFLRIKAKDYPIKPTMD